jgi:hypothetical protein
VAAAQPASASEAAATAPNVQPVPASDAMPPSTGPSSAPTTAAAKAWPMSAPRRPAGEAATSHASAPVQENALARPWHEAGEIELPRRLRDSEQGGRQGDDAQPDQDVGLTPSRAATTPLGSEPTSAPTGRQRRAARHPPCRGRARARSAARAV